MFCKPYAYTEVTDCCDQAVGRFVSYVLSRRLHFLLHCRPAIGKRGSCSCKISFVEAKLGFLSHFCDARLSQNLIWERLDLLLRYFCVLTTAASASRAVFPTISLFAVYSLGPAARLAF